MTSLREGEGEGDQGGSTSMSSPSAPRDAPPSSSLFPPRAGAGESWIDKVPGLAARLEAPRRRHFHGGIRGSMMEACRRLEVSEESDNLELANRYARSLSLIDPDELAGRAPLVPPLNFELVALGGLYRSGHPNERNFSFLRTLGLKSILYLGTEEYRANMRTFAKEEGIQVFQVGLESNKEPFDEMDHAAVMRCLEIILNPQNCPMLVHCNKGKYRVGCVIGCLRKLQGWLHASIFDEFARWAGDRYADFEFIEVFDPSQLASARPSLLQDGTSTVTNDQ